MIRKKDKIDELKDIVMNHKLFFSSILFVLILIGSIAFIHDMYAPPADPIKFTWEGILMFMGVCAGIGWIIHGTGFLIVRVK